MTPNEIEKMANDIAEETQLDRIEKKLDCLLEKSKEKEQPESLSTEEKLEKVKDVMEIWFSDKKEHAVTLDSKEVSNKFTSDFELSTFQGGENDEK